MKNVHLITQAKGGTGKSFVTWFFAYINKGQNASFVDLDKSTRTSAKRLGKIVGDKRVVEMSIIDGNLRLDREKFLNILEGISQSKTDNWFIDLGAPESDELKTFFQNDYGVDDFKEVLDSIGINLKIYVVIAGEDALSASSEFYSTLKNLLGDAIPVIALKNEGTFKTIAAQQAGDQYLAEMGISAKSVCKTPIGSSSTEIIKLIGNELEETNLSLAGKLGLKKMVDSFKTALVNEQ